MQSEVLAAIEHHDDGWAAWEARTELDAETGRPLSFLELPTEESLSIWSDSVRIAAGAGDLAGYMVAGHFLTLLEHSEHAAVDPAGVCWRDEHLSIQSEVLTRWLEGSPATRTPEVAEEALHWLQWADVLSLWLCGAFAERDSMHVFDEGRPLETTFVRRRREGAEVCSLQPWRFAVPEFELEAAAWVVPQRSYASSEELLECRQTATLRWTFAE
jgi:hypothetical protein